MSNIENIFNLYDILDKFYEYTIPFMDRPNIGRNNSHMTANARHIAIAYQECEHIDIYQIDSKDKFKHISTIGTPVSKNKLPDNPSFSKMKYIKILSDSKYIYAINARTDTPALMNQTPIYFYVEVYKWNGDRVSAFKLDRPNVIPVFASQKEKAIFAFNPREDFKQTLKYKLP